MIRKSATANLVLVVLLLLISSSAFSQSTVQIRNANKMEQIQDETGDYRLLTGEVEILTDSTTILTDTLYQYTTTGDLKIRSGGTFIRPDSTVLISNHIDYNDATEIAYFGGYVQLTYDGAVLDCDSAVYDTKQKTAHCIGNVVLNSDSLVVYSDEAEYREEQEEISCYPNQSELQTGELTILSDSIVYLKATEELYGYYNSFLSDSTGKKAISDSIYLNRNNSVLELYQNALIKDSSLFLAAHYIYLQGDSLLMAKEDVSGYNDTIAFASQYLWFTDEVKQLTDQVFFFQSTQDTLGIFASDSVTIVDSTSQLKANDTIQFLFTNRIGFGNYLTVYDSLGWVTGEGAHILEDSSLYVSDSIIFWKSDGNSSPDSILLTNNSSIYQFTDSTGKRVNQIEGKNIQANILNDSLSILMVPNNAKCFYHLKDDENAPIGMNVIESASMEIYVRNQKVSEIKAKQQSKANLTPDNLLTDSDLVDVPAQLQYDYQFERNKFILKQKSIRKQIQTGRAIRLSQYIVE